MIDPEIEAMGTVAAALEKLADDAARSRVLRWAAERYAVALPTARTGGRELPPGEGEPRGNKGSGKAAPAFEDFVDLLDAVDPTSDVDKALTGAYWLQVVEGESVWQSMKVNNLLKDTGHGLTNVTSALTDAQSRSPSLVRQVGKSGKSRQARKTYKLTTSGVAHIRTKLGLTGAVPPALADQDEDEDE
jgi:hypothetical protein